MPAFAFEKALYPIYYESRRNTLLFVYVNKSKHFIIINQKTPLLIINNDVSMFFILQIISYGKDQFIENVLVKTVDFSAARLNVTAAAENARYFVYVDVFTSETDFE